MLCLCSLNESFTFDTAMSRQQCESCKSWCNRRHKCESGGEMRCKQCQRDNLHNHNQLSSPTPSKPQQPLEIFSHSDEDTNRMTAEQRRGIVILYQDNNSIDEICMKVGCSKPTAYHWINHYRITGNFNDDLREGRKRKLDELTIDEIIETSHQDHFKTPKGNQRISFGEGYKHFTSNDWCRVMSLDEKKFTCDSKSGKVWVQRPIGHRYDPEFMYKRYIYDKNNPPDYTNAIVCFSGTCTLSHSLSLSFPLSHFLTFSFSVCCLFIGKGLGFLHLYEDELTSKLLISILKKYLITAVNKLYVRGEDWMILWDNDSTHTSRQMDEWLHTGCTKVVKIPSHSPELNIAENLFANLAPRVEQHNAKTTEQLRKAIESEWNKTDLSLLSRMSDRDVRH